MSFYSLWILSALAATVLVSLGPRQSLPRSLLWPACGVIAGGALVLSGWIASIGAVAVLVILVTVIELAQPRLIALGQFGAGLVGSQVAIPFVSNGAPLWLALSAGALVVFASIWIRARSEHFASGQMHDEALLLILLLAIVLGSAPGVHAGWESAVALNRG